MSNNTFQDGLSVPYQFYKNVGSISKEDQLLLSDKTVVVVGCGGLGGFLIEYTARLGIGRIIAVDGDVFSESNLNRQLTSSHDVLGKSKVLCAKERALSINPNIQFDAICDFLTEENAAQILKDADIILDGLDNPKSRLVMEKAAKALGKTIIHGALSGWTFQVSTVPPESNLLSILYEGKEKEENSSTLSFVPGICAGIQVSEAVKVLTGKEPSLAGKLLIVDIKNMDFDIVGFSPEMHT